MVRRDVNQVSLKGLLLLCIVLRAAIFFPYALRSLTSDRQAGNLEGANVNLIWRAAHDRPLYPESKAYPYAVNYMTPVYYWTVGALSHGDGSPSVAHLYWIGRCLTLICCFLVPLLAASRQIVSDGPITGTAALAYGMTVGPVIGFGVMVRPDMLADLFGILGFMLITKGSVRTVVLGGVFLWLAVMTKQTAVSYLLASTFVILLRGSLRRAGAVCAAVGLAVSLGLGLIQWSFEPHILESLFTQSAVAFSSERFITLCISLCLRHADMLLLTAIGCHHWYKSENHDERKYIVLAIASLSFAILTIGKLGSELNYFLPFRFLATLAMGGLLARSCHNGKAQITWIVVIVAMGMNAAMMWLDIARFENSRLLQNNQQLVELAADQNVQLLTDADQLAAHQGDRAAFLDAYFFRLRAEAGRVNLDPLVQSVQRQQFDYIVTRSEILQESYAEFFWRLPKRVADAVRANYMLTEQYDGFYVYKPIQKRSLGVAAD